MAKTALAWKTLTHAHGPATRVPAQVKTLTGRDESERQSAYVTLKDTLVGNGRWFRASALAVDLLFGSLGLAAAPEMLLLLVADIVGGDHVRAWLLPEDAPVSDEAAPVHRAAVVHESAIAAMLGSKKARVRAAAAVLAQTLPELAATLLPLLKKQARGDRDDAARASALLALARLGAKDEETPAILDAARSEHERPGVSGAATLAMCRRNGTCFSDDAAGLERWLGWELTDPDELPWFDAYSEDFTFRGMPFPETLTRGVVALAAPRGEAAMHDLVGLVPALAASALRSVPLQTAKVLLELGDFLRFVETVALYDELTPIQGVIAKAMAATALSPRAGYGLPACGAARRRWSALDPPGPLEGVLEIDLDGKRARLPVWRAWIQLQARNQRGKPVPTPLDAHLSGLDRWEAAIEFLARTYGATATEYLDAADIERELARVPAGPELFARAERIADDLAARFEAAERQGHAELPSLEASALLLLPLVRAKRPLASRWASILHLGEQPLARELFAAFDPKVREDLLHRFVATSTGGATRDNLERAIATLDLAPSARVLRALDAKLGQTSDRDFAPLRKQVAALKKKYPELSVR